VINPASIFCAVRFAFQNDRHGAGPMTQSTTYMMSYSSLKTCIAACLFLTACSCSSREPVQVGFVGGISGRVADLGIDGRNGAILAVEERNAKGGIDGRRIDLLIRDDHQDAGRAREAMLDLINNQVVAVVGPMTSAMAVVLTPLANQHHVLTMGVTVTTNELTGLDDYFFRVVASTRHHAGFHANHAMAAGKRSFSLAYDLNNRAYSESWVNDFRNAVDSKNGRVIRMIPFDSGNQAQYANLARELLRPRPDNVVLVASAVDAALIAQQIRKHDSAIPISTTEWAASERLIELGGRAIEGATVPMYMIRDNLNPVATAFQKRYEARFGQLPGYPAVMAFNATNVVLDSLAARNQGEDLKQTILRLRQFPGLLEKIRFDEFGDTTNRTYITRIKNGHFVPVH